MAEDTNFVWNLDFLIKVTDDIDKEIKISKFEEIIAKRFYKECEDFLKIANETQLKNILILTQAIRSSFELGAAIGIVYKNIDFDQTIKRVINEHPELKEKSNNLSDTMPKMREEDFKSYT